ncbi:hypothetical protein BRC90_05305 [Halobacteriales archaeon QS_4_69_34]|jgi:hypothetical protein|nr:MAG: hypothetical protein BRC90_05305 [Halobacteriales archaeon QS_4_69_34]
MVDPTSAVGEDTDETAPACAVCGETILNSPTHRVLTWVDDGRAEHRHFCDGACLADYEDH